MNAPDASDEARAWLRLALAEGLGPRTWFPLVSELGSAQAVVEAPLAAWQRQVPGERARRLHRAVARAPVAETLRACRRLGHEVLTPDHPAWPTERLEGLHELPAALFLHGRLPGTLDRTVALVGTREATPYGTRLAATLARDLVRQGVWVISGFAVGIDGAAHEAAVAPALVGRGGRTVGVLAAGLDVDYPAAHGALRGRVVETGGLVTECPPGTRPSSWGFPRRNRIVAALSEIVVVVEAPRRSGALLTAGLALDLGRDVMAVPGPVRASHAGNHLLLKRGSAALCEDARDVIEMLGLAAVDLGDAPVPDPLPDGPARVVHGALDLDDARSLEALHVSTGLPPGEIATALAHLEVEGWVRRVPGVGWRLSR